MSELSQDVEALLAGLGVGSIAELRSLVDRAPLAASEPYVVTEADVGKTVRLSASALVAGCPEHGGLQTGGCWCGRGRT